MNLRESMLAGFLGVTHDIIDDRIDVVTRGTMGLSVACARCHDHKFDPIPTADYYSLYGVFQNSIERLAPIAEPAAGADGFADELAKRQTALAEKLARMERTRLAEECAKLAPREERQFADEGLAAAEDTWPEY